MRRKVAALLAATGFVLLAACHKSPAPLAPSPVRANSDSLDRARADSIAQAEAARRAQTADSLRALRSGNAGGGDAGMDAARVLAATIYYDYDRAELTDAARALLLAKARVLQAQPATRVRITGHTDDRGASEYNLALGLRRAAEAKAFLVANGADAGHIEIGSMGEEQPAVQGDNEEAWSKNRRAEFTPLSGSEAQ
ncbi:MAG: OmpA family protein [Gemmatimonadaceae bacterium]